MKHGISYHDLLHFDLEEWDWWFEQVAEYIRLQNEAVAESIGE